MRETGSGIKLPGTTRRRARTRAIGVSVVIMGLAFAQTASAVLGVVSETKLLPNDGGPYDFFGWSADVGGDTAIVGARGATGPVEPATGAVYTYDRVGPSWLPGEKLVASDGDWNDGFGNASAISGEYIVVGAPFDDDGGEDAGAVYLFKRTAPGDWSEVAKIRASDATAQGFFGNQVAIDGTTVVVGAGDNSGSAYVLDRDAAGFWAESAKLVANAGGFYTRGIVTPVAVSGDTALVGSTFESPGGAVYVFERDGGGAWSLAQKLVGGTELGTSVAIDGNVAAIGDIGDYGDIDQDSNPDWGAAFIFERAQGGWTQTGKVKASGSRGMGWGTAISGETVLVGAAGDDRGPGTGAAFVIHKPGDEWVLGAKLLATDVVGGDDFGGGAVGIDRQTVVVGARYHGIEYAGAAWVFDFEDVPPAEVINTVEDEIGDLVIDGTLTSKDAQGALRALGKSQTALADGKLRQAIQSLEKFIKEIEKLVKKRRLTLAEAQPLIDTVQAVIDDINGG